MVMARSATTTDVFAAVAEPRRRQILELLAPGERPVNDVARLLRLTQPQVSKHLKVLKEVGLVQVREAGQQRFYSVNGRAIEPIHAWSRRFEALWNDRFDRLDDASKADRDGHLGSGMEHGMHETHARLDALLAELARAEV